MNTRVLLAICSTLLAAGGASAAPRRGETLRPQGPCDIYAAAGTPCVAAHSTTRALFGRYRGPLYQLLRRSDGRTQDIGVVRGARGGMAAGYADAAAQDRFCAGTICVINRIYDQSGHGNALLQAAPGTFKGPAQGGFDTQPIADMAPVSIMGHKAYGVFIMPGMGLRNNNARGLAIGDEAEGIYYVVDGTHYDSGCCFDYGNASTNGRAVGAGTMETTYFGTSTVWGRGDGAGPWIMSDMEAGLFSGYDAKQNADPTIDRSRFVTAVMNGGGGNRWELRGGDGERGALSTIYSGVRPESRENARYWPMHRQGAVLLGTGGDNGNGSSGTFYEGVMVAGSPSDATTDAVQANIVAAHYRAAAIALPRIASFAPGATRQVPVTFTNPTDKPITDVSVSAVMPAGWRAQAPGGQGGGALIRGPLTPGASVALPFTVTAPPASGTAVLQVRATWRARGGAAGSDAAARVRAVLPVKINEVRFSAAGDVTDQFIELFNASDAAIDISGWRLSYTPGLGETATLATVPPGTRIRARGFYLLGLAGSGLASPAAGGTILHVRTVAGIRPGQRVIVDGESRTVRQVGSAAERATTVFVPVSTGPWLTVPAGATRMPITEATGFVAGEAIGIGSGERYEVATVASVGKAGTQTILAQPARAGDASIVVAASAAISAGDTLTLDTGDRVERAPAASLGATAAEGMRVTLGVPLRRGHRKGVDVSDPGTGLSLTAATRLPHRSGDAVQALGSGLLLDAPLARRHPAGAPIVVEGDTAGGYRGGPVAHQLFGTPLSTSAGALALIDAGGTITDALVYGSRQSNSSANGTIVDPELAVLEGDQGGGGCIAVAPVAPGSFGPLPAPVDATDRSLSRYPDGADTDSNCADFRTQPATTLPAGAKRGATTLNVPRVAGFAAGETVTIGRDADAEQATLAAIGTAGVTRTTAALQAGATKLDVETVTGFGESDTITIGNGAERETAIVASANGARSGAWIGLAAPLAHAHPVGTEVDGSGLRLAGPLRRPHAQEAPVSLALPTPGTPNRDPRSAD